MNARSFLANHFKLTALLLALCLTAQAQRPSQTPVRQSTDDARIARLVGLAKVWGTVKYFHPFLAYRDIDWDKALVETIPIVEAAKTPQEYQAAVNQLLAALGDKSTRAELEIETKAATPNQPAASTKEPVRVEDGVLIIEATRAARTGAQDTVAFRRLLGRIDETIPTATKAIVIDLRDARQPDDSTSYFFSMLLRRIMPLMLDANVTLGSTRYRIHNGYPTQTGAGAGFYYSAFANIAPGTIAGQNQAKTPPIVFIVNENSPAATDVLSGLQSAGRAFVIQEGEQAQELGGGTYTLVLPDEVKVRIRTSEPVNPDGSVGFQADAFVSKRVGEDTAMREALLAAQQNKVGQTRARTSANVTTQVSQNDKTYAEMSFPGREYRLLALFRFWNVINYFFPYKDLIGASWQTVLPRYIPKFEANKDASDYQLTVREMVAEMRDSHGGVQNANASAEKLGLFLPPILLSYVEGHTVVTNVLDDKLPVKIGDVILTIDGEPVERRREFLSRFIAASTPQALEKNVHAGLLRGQKDSAAKLRVRGADGAVREVELARSTATTERKLFTARQRSTPVVQVLPGGYGYVDLARLQVGEVDQMFETIKGTPAVIFDMRGYPNGTAWAVAPRLTEKTMPVAALFSRPLLEATGLGDAELAGSVSYSFTQKLPARNGDAYKGRVVMLINEDAISQAEHTCLFFEVATDVTFIGTPTTGANGDVTFMVLPGNLPVAFTGHDVRHADGRQLQRVGIQPSIKAAPTIRGVAAGHDEVLDRAVKYLQENVKK